MRAWSTVKAGQARLWGDQARHAHVPVDVAFRLADRDKRVAAGVLAGGVAYRFFFWLISCFVLLTGGLGFGDGHRVADVVNTSGLDPSVAQVVVDSWEASQGFHWWLLLVGAGWSCGPGT